MNVDCSPPCKVICLEVDPGSSSEDELPEDIIFLSDSSNDDSDVASQSSSDGFIFPSDSDEQTCDDLLCPVDDERITPPEASTPHRRDTEQFLAPIANVLTSKCCGKLCVRDLTVNNILFCRKKFNSMCATPQRQWITDKIHENSQVSPGGKLITKYVIAGKEVCQAAFCESHSISMSRLSKLRKNASLGQVNVEHGNLGKKRSSPRVEEAKVWMERYFNLIGDKLPDKLKIHLPSWETQRDVFNRYKEDMTGVGIPEDEFVSLSTFYRVWHDDFCHVSIPEVSLLLSYIIIRVL